MWVQRVFQNVYVFNLKNWLSVVASSTNMPFYAVARGRSVGIYQSWAECEAQVKGFSGARYKKFDVESSALEFVRAEGGSSFAPKTKQNFTKNKPKSNTNSQKKAFSTSSSHQSNESSSGSNSQNKSQAWHDMTGSDDDSSSDDDLNAVLNKQMDDIESRLKAIEKGVDEIEKKGLSKGSKSSGRKAIVIEPPAPKRAKRSKTGFEEDSQGFVQVYTDGACSANGRSGARAGIGVYWGDDHILNVSEPVSGRATNNCGEIQAASQAMKQAIENNIKNLTINTDSQFLINSVTKWLPGCKRKGWKLASGEPVKNEIDFKELDSLQHKLNIKWNYVEAHRGIYGNEMADQLAKAGAAMYK